MGASQSPHRKQVVVGLAFTSENLMPTVVTDIMGISPTKCYSKGEVSPGRRVPRPWGCWSIDAESDDVEDAVRRVVGMIQGRRSAILDIVARYSPTVSASIWWEPDGGQGGYSLPAELVAELSSYVDRVDFYFASGSCQDDPAG